MCCFAPVKREYNFGKKYHILLQIIALLLFLLLVAGCNTPLRSDRVIDGDTFVVTDLAVIRLWGVDAPEMDQPFGQEAKEALIKLLGHRRLTIEQKGTSFRRLVARVHAGRQDVALELLKQGLAWHDSRYAPKQDNYARAEAEAKSQRLGVWSDPDAVPPWRWRKQHNLPEQDN